MAQNLSQVQQQQAGLTFAQQQASRYSNLAKDGWGTMQDAQQGTSQQRQGEAALQSAQSALIAAARQLGVLKAQRGSAEANFAQATAQRDQAKLNLSYRIVAAAQPGRVVQLSGAVGQYAQPGTALTMFVPDDIGVTANFKENDLTTCGLGTRWRYVSTLTRDGRSRGMSRACSQDPAPPSRCCRPRTPPATTSRSSSADP